MAKIYPILQCNIQKYFLIQLEAKHVLERELMIRFLFLILYRLFSINVILIGLMKKY